MERAKVFVDKIIIPTYKEPDAEELPMFAENRVHQRTSGRPYPNKVVMQVDRSEKTDKEYTRVTLENEYLKIEILPEIGGRIYSAFDKTTGYDFFYKQHVIKPALIGVLGSWISGGVEFNWPFHHRASGFMPCDFSVEELEDGSAVCHLSEHDPIDRMKGMVSVILRKGESSFETKMRLYNRTPSEKSFLWWENAAVPVNESYQIFFPQDVSYVNFHYLKSRTTFPVAGKGVYNGIQMDTERDISWHKNTKQATSYFACASDYDFFGGYDHSRECGVVHIGDHHITPGKKMFTWAYCQLAKSWENALTDTDGQYAELMAGSYSDNQPDFSWLAAYETKEFSQMWYPISKIGVPNYANINCAFRVDREKKRFALQVTKKYKKINVRILNGEEVLFEKEYSASPDVIITSELDNIPKFVRVSITADGEIIAEYTEKDFDRFNMPEVIKDMPNASDMISADELYLAGVHVDQYRDPATLPNRYWMEALKRDPHHIPSLIAMAKYEMGRYEIDSAYVWADKAIELLTAFNTRMQSGDAYYTMARVCEMQGNTDKAYDLYYKAFWSQDSVARAMTRIAILDIRRHDYKSAVKHAETSLIYGGNNNLAHACLVIAKMKMGESVDSLVNEQLKKDPLDHMMRFISGKEDFYNTLDSDPLQTCFDIAFDLFAMGEYNDIVKLLTGLEKSRPDSRRKMLYYALWYFNALIGKEDFEYIEKANRTELGKSYPVRFEEKIILEQAIEKTEDSYAKMLYGCLLYNKCHYDRAAELWGKCGENYIAKRNLAVAYFSHLKRGDDAQAIMKELVEKRPYDEQLLYETVVLMSKMGVSPNEKIELIKKHNFTREDIFIELARAYNQAFCPDLALNTLASRVFVPCEGGEHAIAEQYMFAYLVKGKCEFDAGKLQTALEFFRKGQNLPQYLGAGIWNHCKLIPLKYHEALCLEALGDSDGAKKIFEYIAHTKIEYFSNMHLKELPYWQAKSYEHLGERIKAQNLITVYRREWGKIAKSDCNGYFTTTPFFISFVDEPEKLKAAQGSYLMSLCLDFAEEHDAAKNHIKDSISNNSENMFALFFNEFGFLN